MSEQGTPMFRNLWLGAASSFLAVSFVQPFDTIKTNIQLRAEGHRGFCGDTWAVARQITNEQGMLGLWAGLDAQFFRTLAFTTSRILLYRNFVEHIEYSQGERASLKDRTIASMYAGAVAGFASTPFDMAMVRLQAEKYYPEGQRRGYRSVFDAIGKATAKEGVFALWKGAYPTMGKSIGLALMMPPYEQAKDWLGTHTTDLPTTKPMAAMWACFWACALSLPFDNMKTKLQNQQPLANGKMRYRNAFDCFMKTSIREGVYGFYSGFWAYYARVTPQAILVFFNIGSLYCGCLAKSFAQRMIAR